MEERERRKRVRENDMHRRRDIHGAVDGEDQEAADRRAQEDDEEVCTTCQIEADETDIPETYGTTTSESRTCSPSLS